MRQTLTVSLPEAIKEELDAICAEDSMSRSEIVRESLQAYLFSRRFRSLRSHLIAKARKQGGYSDEEVFQLVS